MDPIIVGLLVAILLSQVIIAVGISVCAYLAYRTLVRPEAPCFAGMMNQMPQLGMMSIDPSHPAYNALAKKLHAGKTEGAKADGTGNYL